MGNTFVEDSNILSDNELVARICAGEYGLLEILSDRYMYIIKKIAKRNSGFGLDVEDLIQEGVIALFSAVSSYKAGSASFHTFAVLCISRGITSAVRSCKASKRIPDKLISSIDDTELEDITASPEKMVIDEESFKNLADNIKLSLSRFEYRVLCKFLSGSSYKVIAESMGVSEKSVDNALRRIRVKLKSK